MDMNRAFFLRNEDREPKWVLIDAEGKVLGRLATKVASILRGKNKPTYTPHIDSGDYVVIINADKIHLSGKKKDIKIYQRYSGYLGGLKELSFRQVFEKDPTRIISLAVKRMLPKGPLTRKIFKNKLKIYAGAKHPHKAQIQ
jgi:large subunit ribosomal protein L13